MLNEPWLISDEPSEKKRGLIWKTRLTTQLFFTCYPH